MNVSDLAAKGARPLGYLMALSFPAAPASGWLARFAAGLKVAQETFGCHLIGGDTDRRPGPLTVSITAIGTVASGRMIKRGTARAGDAVFVSGTIGDAGLGLALRNDPGLAGRWGLSPSEADHLRHRYARPQPRLALAPALRAHASAAMDVSDGLVKDLERLARASSVSARLEAGKVPLSPAARRCLSADAGILPRLLTAGDDYEVLATVPPAQADDFARATAGAGIPVARIGEIGEAKAGLAALEVLGLDGEALQLASPGWDHF